jgi:hypothetical protein
LTAVSGDRVTTWQVDQCFAGVNGVVHYQLRQQADSEFRLRYIPEPDGPNPADMEALVARLKSLLCAPVAVEAVPVLLPEASGKFRLTCRAE